jgi:tartrate dehydratase alpha subunit/fumarate hydratase class I-like protein
MCQDTGTAIIMGKKGRLVWTYATMMRRSPRARAMERWR